VGSIHREQKWCPSMGGHKVPLRVRRATKCQSDAQCQPTLEFVDETRASFALAIFVGVASEM
jgi:hypothetical protein